LGRPVLFWAARCLVWISLVTVALKGQGKADRIKVSMLEAYECEGHPLLADFSMRPLHPPFRYLQKFVACKRRAISLSEDAAHSTATHVRKIQ
jgi:hypothetical protein